MEFNSFRKQFADIEDAFALAQAIVDTVREPVLVFDKDLRVIAARISYGRRTCYWRNCSIASAIACKSLPALF
jgi:hypothetical protein